MCVRTNVTAETATEVLWWCPVGSGKQKSLQSCAELSRCQWYITDSQC